MDIAVADYFMLVLALLFCIVASVALSVRHGHRCRGLRLARLGRPAAESRHRARGHLSRSCFYAYFLMEFAEVPLVFCLVILLLDHVIVFYSP